MHREKRKKMKKNKKKKWRWHFCQKFCFVFTAWMEGDGEQLLIEVEVDEWERWWSPYDFSMKESDE